MRGGGQTKILRRDEGLQVRRPPILHGSGLTGMGHIASIGTVTDRSRFTRSYVATGSRDLLFSYLERIPTFIYNR